MSGVVWCSSFWCISKIFLSVKLNVQISHLTGPSEIFRHSFFIFFSISSCRLSCNSTFDVAIHPVWLNKCIVNLSSPKKLSAQMGHLSKFVATLTRVFLRESAPSKCGVVHKGHGSSLISISKTWILSLKRYRSGFYFRC